MVGATLSCWGVLGGGSSGAGLAVVCDHLSFGLIGGGLLVPALAGVGPLGPDFAGDGPIGLGFAGVGSPRPGLAVALHHWSGFSWSHLPESRGVLTSHVIC